MSRSNANYGLFGFLGWALFILVPSWGFELYLRAYEYLITFFDHMWATTWRLLLLVAAVDLVIILAKRFGYKFRKTWISFLIGLVAGGLLQILLAIFVFGFEF